VFVLVINKQNKSIKDSPENFALLCWQLLEECQLYYQESIKQVVFDKHFHKTTDQKSFDQTLKKLLGKSFSFKHVDSQTEPAVNAADMVAGSALWALTNKEDKYYQIIKEKIVVEKTISWKKMAGKYWHKKTRSNRRKRPSKTSSKSNYTKSWT